jgi:hypothetical protein
MAQLYKRLGALASTGTITTADTLYTASATAATSTVLSTISICNTAAATATYRICINTTAAFATAGYIAYGGTVAANDTVFLTVGTVLDPTNRYLMCSASAATVVFAAFGVEIS